MTAYFDKAHEDLRLCHEALKAASAADDGAKITEAFKRMEDIEQKLLFDVQLCCAMSGFPDDLADAIQIVIARHSLEPLYQVARDLPDEAAQFSYLNRLVFDLHTIFHYLSDRKIPGFCDKPNSILRGFAESRYERRVELMRDPANQTRYPEFFELVNRYDRQNDAVEAELAKP